MLHCFDITVRIQGTKARSCCPFQVQGLRPNAISLEEIENFFFLDDNIIANLATKLPANLAAADGVVYSSEDDKTSRWATNSIETFVIMNNNLKRL